MSQNAVIMVLDLTTITAIRRKTQRINTITLLSAIATILTIAKAITMTTAIIHVETSVAHGRAKQAQCAKRLTTQSQQQQR